MKDDLPLFNFEVARLWNVKFTYQKYCRCRGVCVPMQVKETRQFPACNEAEAKAAVRRFIGDQFLAEYKAINGKVANITATIHLTRQQTLNIISVLP